MAGLGAGAMMMGISSGITSLFTARPPLEYKPPFDTQQFKKRRLGYTGIGTYVENFESAEDYEAHFETFKPIEQRKERRERVQKEKEERMAAETEAKQGTWDPSIYSFESDSYKTLFVGRLSFLTDEHKLKREMEQYGTVKSVMLVYDKESAKPRGYGFVEFEHERDMKTAYKHADGRKIDGRRILVDVERGRTVKDWKPRRVGGGLGSSRKTRQKKTPQEKAEARRQEALAAAREKRRIQTGGDRGGDDRGRGGGDRGGGDRGGDRHGGGDRGGRGYDDRRGGDYRGGDRGGDRRGDDRRGGDRGGDRRRGYEDYDRDRDRGSRGSDYRDRR